MLKKLIFTIATVFSIGVYANINTEPNQVKIADYANQNLMPHEKEYLPYILKGNKSLNCLSNINNVLCGAVHSIEFIKKGNEYHLVTSGFAFDSKFSFLEPIFFDKSNTRMFPKKVLVQSSKDGNNYTEVISGIKDVDKARVISPGYFKVNYVFSENAYAQLVSMIWDASNMPVILNSPSDIKMEVADNNIPVVLPQKDINKEKTTQRIVPIYAPEMKSIKLSAKTNVAEDSVVKLNDNGKESFVATKNDKINIYRKVSFDFPPRIETVVKISSTKKQEVDLGQLMLNGSSLINISSDTYLRKEGKNYLASVKVGQNEVYFEEVLPSLDGVFKVKGLSNVPFETWFITANPNRHSPEGAELISTDGMDIPSNWKNISAYRVADSIAITEVNRNISNLVSESKISKNTYIAKDGLYAVWDTLSIASNENSWDSVVRQSNQSLQSVELKAVSMGDMSRIPLLVDNGKPYFRLKGQGNSVVYYEGRTKSLEPNVYDLDAEVESWSVKIPPRERLLYVKGANFTGEEIGYWGIYSLFWLMFFGFVFFKLVNWRIATLATVSIVSLAPFFGLTIWFIWGLILAAYIGLKFGGVPNKKASVVGTTSMLAFIIWSVGGISFIKQELSIILNPTIEMKLLNERKEISTLPMNFNEIDMIGKEQMFGNAGALVENRARMADEMMPQVASPVAAPMSNMSLAPQIVAKEATVKVLEAEDVKSSQQMRDVPKWKNVNHIYSRSKDINLIGTIKDNTKVEFMIAPAWIVNVFAIFQMVIVVVVSIMLSLLVLISLKNKEFAETIMASKMFDFFFAVKGN